MVDCPGLVCPSLVGLEMQVSSPFLIQVVRSNVRPWQAVS